MGIGNNIETKKLLKYLLDNYENNLIIDADGLNAFEGKVDYLLDKEGKFINKDEIKCPECNSSEVEKQFSLFSAGSSETNKPMRVSCQEKKSSGCCNGCCHHHHH